MATNKREVGTLGEALLLINEYPNSDKILSFVVAPLVTLRGGQRSWQGLKDVDGGETVWAPEKDKDVYAPPLDLPAFPPLPDSPINRWSFAFVDEDSKILRPEVEINPARVASGAGPTAAPPPPPPPPPSTGRAAASAPRPPRDELIAELITGLRGANEDNRLLMAEARGALAEGRSTVSTMRSELQVILEERRAAAAAIQAESERIKRERDQALSANQQLAIVVAEQKAQSQVGETVRAIYGGKPAEFTGAVREVLGGLVHAIKDS